MGIERHDTASVVSGRSFIGESLTMTGVEGSEKGVGSVAIILYKTIQGAGTLAMPRAMLDAGIVTFSMLMVVMSSCSHYGCSLLAKALDVVGRDDLDIAALGEHCMGRRGFVFAMVVTFLDSWGAVVGSLRMIAELISPILQSHSVLGENSVFGEDWFIIAAVALMVYPMMLYRDITKLGWINILGIIAMLVFAVTIVAKAIASGNSLEGRSLMEWDVDAALSIPVIAFSFDCQVNVFGSYRDIAGEPGHKSPSLIKASFIANSCAAVSYIIVALSGYVTYLGSTSGDVLGNLPSTLDAVKIIFGVSVMLSFPVQLLECSTILQEHVIIPLVWGNSGGGDEEDDVETEVVEPPAQLVNILTNLFIISSAAAVAAFVPSMYTAFAFVGATTATTNTAIIPPLYYLMTVKRHYPGFSIFSHQTASYDSLHRDKTDVQSHHTDDDANDDDHDSDTLSVPETDRSDARTVNLVSGPPNQWLQRLAAAYLCAGCTAVPVLVYVTAIGS